MSKEETPLDRFYDLYEKGRKQGHPQNFIGYFESRAFLLDELDHQKQVALKAMAEEIKNYPVGDKEYPSQLGMTVIYPNYLNVSGIIDEILAKHLEKK